MNTYVKTIWDGQSRITPERMNKIENQLYLLTEELNMIQSQLNSALTELRQEIQSNSINNHNTSSYAHMVKFDEIAKNISAVEDRVTKLESKKK